jgi:hypothetical protein
MQNVFVFKGISIHIWVYYLPPDNAEVRQELINMVQQIDLTDNRNMHIWIGDSNYVINQTLDKSNSNVSSRFHKDFITSLTDKGFHDAFRSFNTHAKQYSYTKKTSQHNNDSSEPSITKTRIDHIWIPFNYIQLIESFNHEEAQVITENDHAILNLKLHTADIIRNAYKHTGAVPTIRPPFRQIAEKEWVKVSMHNSFFIAKITFKSPNSSTVEVQPYKFIPTSAQNGIPSITMDGITTRLVQRSQLSVVEVFQDSQGIHRLLSPIVWFPDEPTSTLQPNLQICMTIYPHRLLILPNLMTYG